MSNSEIIITIICGTLILITFGTSFKRHPKCGCGHMLSEHYIKPDSRSCNVENCACVHYIGPPPPKDWVSPGRPT